MQIFKSFDIDKDGRINLSDLHNSFMLMRMIAFSMTEVEKIMKYLDKK